MCVFAYLLIHLFTYSYHIHMSKYLNLYACSNIDIHISVFKPISLTMLFRIAQQSAPPIHHSQVPSLELHQGTLRRRPGGEPDCCFVHIWRRSCPLLGRKPDGRQGERRRLSRLASPRGAQGHTRLRDTGDQGRHVYFAFACWM